VIGIFKANNPFNAFLLFIYGLLLKLAWFIHPQIPVTQESDGFLFRKLLGLLGSIAFNFPFIYPLTTYFLLFIQAITFNKLINEPKMLQRVSYLPAMSYLLITSMFSGWNVLTAPLVINTFLIWVWANMSTLYNNTKPKSTLYNMGLLIGVCSLFYFPSLAFVILIIFALLFSRPFIVAEWVISFLGVLTPYYFLLSYLFLTDNLMGYKLPRFKIRYPVFHPDIWQMAGICLIVVTLLLGMYYMHVNLKRLLVQIRSRWKLILLYFVIALLVPFASASHIFEYWILTAIPLAAYTACAFLYPVKRWVPVILHGLMVVIVVVVSLKTSGYILVL
jgi:hypothetical protein